MNTLSYRTRSVSSDEVQRTWHIVDATDLVVGRMCSRVASILRGKHRPTYTPHADTGDFVIVINADKVRFKGNNKWDQKVYISHSQYMGGQKKVVASMMRDKHPERIVEKSIKGMLPKNSLGRQMFRKLFVYAGPNHPHAAQKPQPLKFDGKLLQVVDNK